MFVLTRFTFLKKKNNFQLSFKDLSSSDRFLIEV